MVTIPDLAQSTVNNALKDSLKYIEDKRVRERDYLMDWYEGANVEDYIGKYFRPETLSQIPILNQNITRRVCSMRSLTYKRPPRMRVSENYLNAIEVEGLNANRRLLERLTFLLGTMAFRSKWNEVTGKLEYEVLSHYTPIFLAGDSREKVLLTYMIKHIDGLCAYADGHNSQREDVRGRLTDIIVYCCLFWGMVVDKKENGWKIASAIEENQEEGMISL